MRDFRAPPANDGFRLFSARDERQAVHIAPGSDAKGFYWQFSPVVRSAAVLRAICRAVAPSGLTWCDDGSVRAYGDAGKVIGDALRTWGVKIVEGDFR